MRIAFVDLMFAWPPQGGAQANLFHTIEGLQKAGCETHLFAPVYGDLWRQTGFDQQALPFPSAPIRMDWMRATPSRIRRVFRQAVDAWEPDVVFIGFGRYLKPYLIQALAHYPVVSRYFMYEHLCILDGCLYKDYRTCQNDFLHTPNVCRQCAEAGWSGRLKMPNLPPHAYDFTAAKTLHPSYHSVFVDSLGKCKGVVVNNEMARQRCLDHCSHVCVIPSGVNVSEYSPEPLPDAPSRNRKVILMTGRAYHPLKGVDVLVDAGHGLAQFRSDFEVWVTDDEDPVRQPWFKARGWRDPEATRRLYQEADIVVVPSVWEEPFGRVAVEGMAACRPVVASRTGGLQHIVRHGETGYLFEPGSSAELALYLERMLDDPASCRRMGLQGREVAAVEYDWEAIIQDHYIPLLEHAVS
ncbi:MAG: glycosyltransferase family 4 protein [Candidatus Hydrogenedentota bacterium]